jgi:lysophospholipase L1-like esterase
MLAVCPMRGALLIGGCVALAFLAGIVVGHYELPPFEQLRAVKRALPFRDGLGLRVGRGREGPKADLVMLGDSITAGGAWTQRFPQANIVNLGVDGDTSAGIMSRLDDIVAREPRVVFLMVGVNDLLRKVPVSLVESETQFIVSRLLQYRIRPIVQSTLLLARDEAGINGQIQLVNDRMREWCTERKVTFVDLNAALSSGGRLRPELSDDGLHLNSRGYAVWAELISSYIKAVGN